MSATLWAIGSGKGGVGKTFMTSSLAITLSRLNNRVLVIDLDTCGGNIHTVFGESPTKKSILSFFTEKTSLIDLSYQTSIPKLSVVQGFTDSWHEYNISKSDIENLISQSKSLNFDYVLFDLGPGPTMVHLELFKNCDERILITNPEPTTIEKNYRFIEAFISNSLKEKATAEEFLKLQNAIHSYRQDHKTGHFSFRNYLKSATGLSFDFFEEMQSNPIRIVVNQTRSQLDEDLGYSIKSVCNKFYDLSVDFAGYVEYDNSVWQSVKNKESVLVEKPFTPIAGQVLSICKQISSTNLHAKTYRAVI